MLALLVAATSSPFARADNGPQAASQTAPASVTPPRLQRGAEPPYPAGGKGDAEVVVVLVVEATGKVLRADVERGEEPFASAAAASAMRFVYEPAKRGSTPIAAKVRVLVRFHAPAAEPASPPDASPSAPSRTTRPAVTVEPSDTEEVRITGLRREAGLTATLTRSEVRELPGTFGDPFRALEVMPGVTPIISGLPFFYVRGAPPGNVGYFLDGIRVPYLYHVGLGPSVVHPGIVERVDLYGGGYPARYGRFAGGTVAAELARPRTDAHAEWNVRLVDAGALAETGFAGDRGTLLVGGRYSYTAALITLFAPDAVLDYRDFQLRATYDVSPVDTVSLVSFGAYDLIGQKRSGVLDVAFGSEFYRGDLRWDRKLEGGGRLRSAVTLGLDRTLLGEDRVARNRTVATRVEWSKPMRQAVLLRGGVDMTRERYDTELLGEDSADSAATAAAFPSRTDLTTGAWVDVVYKPTRAFEVVPGLRADLYNSGGVAAAGIDPRIATKLALSKRVRLLQAHGVAHQPPSFVAPIPGLTIGSLQGGLQRAMQTSAGVEADLPLEFTGSMTVFRTATLNLTDFLTSAARFDTDDQRAFVRRATGDAYGAEVFVRRPLTKRFAALLSYTLSRSTQRESGVVRTGAYDRPHVFNVAGAVDLGARWRFGAKFVTYSGNPRLFSTRPSDAIANVEGAVAERRNSAFYRIDARLEKKWVFGKRASVAVVFEVLNATLHKEDVNGQEIGPITVPSLGVEGEL